MKVCIVVDTLDTTCGWGRLADKIGSGLRDRGHHVGYLSQDTQGVPEAVAVSLRGFAGRGVYQKLRDVANTLRSMRQTFRTYDVVFCYDINPFGILVCVTYWSAEETESSTTYPWYLFTVYQAPSS